MAPLLEYERQLVLELLEAEGWWCAPAGSARTGFSTTSSDLKPLPLGTRPLLSVGLTCASSLRDTIGVSEETLKEFSTTYKHFDDNLTGRLTHKDFRSCLRGLNYYLPMVEEGEPESKFEKFLDAVDPGRKGYVSLEDYTSFLIDKESENIKSSDEIESGFQTLAEGKAYITKEDMKQALTPEQVAFCASHMQQYVDPRGRGHAAGYDYVGFTNSYFGN
ncbi:spectrin alpha chain, erythrocytic 1-like [Sorex fumeus]|uniref:spectrin alpha chain, erythrocytic 1-like n=1 Tax=Sorex fumeus TaxID=62283 RepID=UPI0024ADF188|nr:spectrin alpha chain, erythrocytic 1-like [Sorex fumeus]